jgi:uncharacterized protein (TIGR02757 family)
MNRFLPGGETERDGVREVGGVHEFTGGPRPADVRDEAHLAWVRGIAESAYARYNHRSFLHPDPLELVHGYSDPADREVVALITSSLALGQVDVILRACRTVLSAFPSPHADLARLSREEITARLEGFVYRFFRTERMSNFLFGIGEALRRYGSLEETFLAGPETRAEGSGDGRSGGSADGCSEGPAKALPAASLQGSSEAMLTGADTVQPALSKFVQRLSAYAGGDHGILLSFPDKGGAGKRLHLFLRWMVRRDELDLGDWRRVRPSMLMVPVDTHMLRIARYLGITERKTADRRASEEITAFFRRFSPEDPAKYDFALTRAGIHPDLARRDLEEVLAG